MTTTLRRVYHITAFSWYAFTVKSLAAKDGEELPQGIFVYGGPWKYLTFLNLVSTLPILPNNNSSNTLVNNIFCRYEKGSCKTTTLLVKFQLLQMTFFGLAAINDLQPGKKSESLLNKWKDLLFSVFAFPVGMVRTILHFLK